MKSEYALKRMRERFEKRLAIRIKKAKDYANEADCLQNFKKVAQLLKLLDVSPHTPHGVAMTYALLKIDRLCNLVFRQKNTNPENESVEDTIEDLQNYLDLFTECLEEQKVVYEHNGKVLTQGMIDKALETYINLKEANE